VVAEIRDKTSRELFNSTLQVLGLESATDLKQAGGLQVKTPSPDSVARGELPALSSTITSTGRLKQPANLMVHYSHCFCKAYRRYLCALRS